MNTNNEDCGFNDPFFHILGALFNKHLINTDYFHIDVNSNINYLNIHVNEHICVHTAIVDNERIIKVVNQFVKIYHDIFYKEYSKEFIENIIENVAKV